MEFSLSTPKNCQKSTRKLNCSKDFQISIWSRWAWSPYLASELQFLFCKKWSSIASPISVTHSSSCQCRKAPITQATSLGREYLRRQTRSFSALDSYSLTVIPMEPMESRPHSSLGSFCSHFHKFQCRWQSALYLRRGWKHSQQACGCYFCLSDSQS